jgi:phosphoglycerate kinase
MGFYKKTVRDIPLAGRTVLVRADYNVPLSSDGTIHDDYRMQQSLSTLKYLIEQNCKVVVCAHLGRPEGQQNPKFSLEKVALHLSELLGQEVAFVPQCVGDMVKQTVQRLPQGSVALLENLRFHSGEEANDPEFAKRLARDSTAAYFVQDGFGVVHRAHASTSAITQFLPGVAGFLVEKEYIAITNAVENPRRPLTVIMGGAKVADKIDLLERFIDIADTVIVAGAMANTFLKSYGSYPIGKSVYDAGADDVVNQLMQKVTNRWCGHDDATRYGRCAECNKHFILPVDVAVGDAIAASAERRNVALSEVTENDYILDMGEQTIARIVEVLEESATVLWNGPLGYAELPQFAYASNFVAGTLATHHAGINSVVGGGDTADFVMHWLEEQHKKVDECFNHVSTGGGASLDLMAGKKLPGIEALLDA